MNLIITLLIIIIIYIYRLKNSNILKTINNYTQLKKKIIIKLIVKDL
jgi:hypothetical protein